MAPVAFHLDHQFWVFACHCQITDTIKFSTNYMLIQQPNGRAPLIKVEEHSEDSNFSIGAKVRICTEYAENGLQVGHSNARHVLDEMTSWRPCTRARPTMADARPTSVPRATSRPAASNRAPELPLVHSLALPSPLSLPVSRSRGRANAAGELAAASATASAAAPQTLHAQLHKRCRPPPLPRLLAAGIAGRARAPPWSRRAKIAAAVASTFGLV